MEKHAEEIVALGADDAGKQLVFNGIEEHGRAIIYKIATAAHNYNLHWGVLFGGDGVILFQRVQSTEPTRYGLLCSGVLSIERMFIFILAMLLVPGNEPLVDVATLKIPLPNEAWASDNSRFTQTNIRTIEGCAVEANEDVQICELSIEIMRGATDVDICFDMPGYEVTTIRLSSTIEMSLNSLPDSPPLLTPPHEMTPPGFVRKDPEVYFAKHATLTLPPQLPLTAPILLVSECIWVGATGAVFIAHIGPLPFIIKAIPPHYQGESELRNEANVYNLLASLQGRILPRMFGLFAGEGWMALIMEHCGNKVRNVSELSLAQRETLWRHACEIHAKGVKHADLELRNLVVASSGDVRVIDYAFSEVGHECEVDTCQELCDFQTLLELA